MQTFTNIDIADNAIRDLKAQYVIPSCTTDGGKIGLIVRLNVKK